MNDLERAFSTLRAEAERQTETLGEPDIDALVIAARSTHHPARSRTLVLVAAAAAALLPVGIGLFAPVSGPLDDALPEHLVSFVDSLYAEEYLVTEIAPRWEPVSDSYLQTVLSDVAGTLELDAARPE